MAQGARQARLRARPWGELPAPWSSAPRNPALSGPALGLRGGRAWLGGRGRGHVTGAANHRGTRGAGVAGERWGPEPRPARARLPGPGARPAWLRGRARGREPARAQPPMEPSGSRAPEPGRPHIPAGQRRPEPPESSPSPAPAVEEAGGAGRDPAGGQRPPPPRPALLRVPPPSLGYGAFRRQVSAGAEPPSPLAAQPPRDAEAAGPEPAPGEAAAGGWAPVELQVDVRVTPVGAAGGSRAPSPAPSTRFLAVPVPESPARPTWGRGEGLAAPPGAPAGRCRCGELGLEELAVLLQRAETDAAAAKLPRAIRRVGLPVYLRSLQWALAIVTVFLAVSAVAIVALASRVGASCQPCPTGWMWSDEHCYYLSTEAQAWEASQAFCSAHQATLPLLSHTQDFLSRYPVTKYSWVGARRGSQGWHWIDGAPLPPPLFSEEDKDQPDLHCVGLQGGKLVAFDCASLRPWVCVKGTE
ncbi:killer cell lectin-like receptor subfamily G member 2 [Talpa occidentalis]|uniref:killer cell lectin-like receptor subfamily G member 2 n=1 Tax=Talpa occidentalis TaxID=50954 RepID=UPI00188FFAF4|nr:killer cell lectin-like receptor subfamily G member 2 [Talpa occidentalis]